MSFEGGTTTILDAWQNATGFTNEVLQQSNAENKRRQDLEITQAATDLQKRQNKLLNELAVDNDYSKYQQKNDAMMAEWEKANPARSRYMANAYKQIGAQSAATFEPVVEAKRIEGWKKEQTEKRQSDYELIDTGEL